MWHMFFFYFVLQEELTASDPFAMYKVDCEGKLLFRDFFENLRKWS